MLIVVLSAVLLAEMTRGGYDIMFVLCAIAGAIYGILDGLFGDKK